MTMPAQVTIGSRKFNIAQAPAVEQKKLLSLIGSKVAVNSAMSQTVKIDKVFLFGSLISLPESKFDEISDIVLYKTYLNGTEKLVDVGDFQNSVTEYYQLVAAAVEVNLQDFFIYLDSVNAEARNKPSEKVQ
jgi:hypothetical protein